MILLKSQTGSDHVPTSYCPLSTLFHMTRAIMILLKSKTGSDHMPTSYCPSFPPDKSNNDSGGGLDRVG